MLDIGLFGSYNLLLDDEILRKSRES